MTDVTYRKTNRLTGIGFRIHVKNLENAKPEVQSAIQSLINAVEYPKQTTLDDWGGERMSDTINLTFPESKCERIEVKGIPFITVDTGMTSEEFILMLLKYGDRDKATGFAVVEKESERMTYTEQDLIDEMEYVTKHEFMVLRHLAENGPKYKTGMMQDIIREFPDDMEHGEYLIPGKEYSDDLDQAMVSLCNDGAIYYVGRKLALTYYGRDLYGTIMAHPEVEIDEDLADFMDRLEGSE